MAKEKPGVAEKPVAETPTLSANTVKVKAALARADKAHAKKKPAKQSAAAALVNSGTAKSKTEPVAATGPAPEFRALRTVPELVEAYNDMVPTALDVGLKKVSTVVMFVDVKTGLLACERLHSWIQKAREAIEKKAKQPSAAKGDSEMAKKSKKVAKSKKSGSVDATKKIQRVVKENPCKKGTGRYARVQKLLDMSGKTVQAFLDKKGKVGTVLHSVKAGWIKLV